MDVQQLIDYLTQNKEKFGEGARVTDCLLLDSDSHMIDVVSEHDESNRKQETVRVTMTTDYLIRRVIDAGGTIAFEPADDNHVRLIAHKAGHTPVTCTMRAKPGDLDFPLTFCRLLEANGFFA